MHARQHFSVSDYSDSLEFLFVKLRLNSAAMAILNGRLEMEWLECGERSLLMQFSIEVVPVEVCNPSMLWI